MERRILAAESRMVLTEGKPRIVGYAAVFNTLSDPIPVGKRSFREKIRPGAFAKSLETGRDVIATFNHRADYILGRRSAGTLRLQEDKRGLLFEVDVPDTSVGRDVVALMQRGDLSGSSFAFDTDEDDWQEMRGGEVERELRAVTLHDVSMVTHPAYPDAGASLRSFDTWVEDRDWARRARLRLETP